MESWAELCSLKACVLCKMWMGIVSKSLGSCEDSMRVNELYFYFTCCFSHLPLTVIALLMLSQLHISFHLQDPALIFQMSFPDLAWKPSLLIMHSWPSPHQTVYLFIVLHMYLYYSFIEIPITICNSQIWLSFLDYILSKVHHIPTFI